MTLSCIIVDDEPIARDIIRTYIAQISSVKIEREFNNAFDALQHLKQYHIDLVILDINMPGLTGLGMLRVLEKYPSIIITSAHQDYALEGFELSVTDYLLKPFSFERFAKAIDKVVSQTLRNDQQGPQSSGIDFVMVKSDGKFMKVFFRDILYVEAHGNYIVIYCGTEKIMSKQTMAQFEQQLPAEMFARVHRSFIISTAAIRSFKGNEISVGLKLIPVGKIYRKEIVKKIRV